MNYLSKKILLLVLILGVTPSHSVRGGEELSPSTIESAPRLLGKIYPSKHAAEEAIKSVTGMKKVRAKHHGKYTTILEKIYSKTLPAARKAFRPANRYGKPGDKCGPFNPDVKDICCFNRIVRIGSCFKKPDFKSLTTGEKRLLVFSYILSLPKRRKDSKFTLTKEDAGLNGEDKIDEKLMVALMRIYTSELTVELYKELLKGHKIGLPPALLNPMHKQVDAHTRTLVLEAYPSMFGTIELLKRMSIPVMVDISRARDTGLERGKESLVFDKQMLVSYTSTPKGFTFKGQVTKEPKTDELVFYINALSIYDGKSHEADCLFPELVSAQNNDSFMKRLADTKFCELLLAPVALYPPLHGHSLPKRLDEALPLSAIYNAPLDNTKGMSRTQYLPSFGDFLESPELSQGRVMGLETLTMFMTGKRTAFHDFVRRTSK